jgi:hypothetical protein
MLLTILVQTINTIISDIEPTDVKITTGCLLYSYLNSQPSKVDLRNRALSFKDYYYSQCIDKKITNRTIGFINIENLIRNKKITNLNDLSITDYETILKYYNSTELELRFDPDRVNPKTYGRLSFKNNSEKVGFSLLHNKYLKPIASYYKNKYSIPYSNLKIVSVGETVVPAREIAFFISEYPSLRIVQDIERGLIMFDKKPSVVKLTSDSFVYMII